MRKACLCRLAFCGGGNVWPAAHRRAGIYPRLRQADEIERKKAKAAEKGDAGLPEESCAVMIWMDACPTCDLMMMTVGYCLYVGASARAVWAWVYGGRQRKCSAHSRASLRASDDLHPTNLTSMGYQLVLRLRLRLHLQHLVPCAQRTASLHTYSSFALLLMFEGA